MTLKFEVSRDGEYFVASWNAPLSAGGITTQAKTLKELEKAIVEAVRCHFDEEEMPQKAVLHFTKNPEVRLREAA
jgi:predicted RNase H-like HicB family nuclease